MAQLDLDMPAEIGRAIASFAAAVFERRGEAATVDLTTAPAAPARDGREASAGRRTK